MAAMATASITNISPAWRVFGTNQFTNGGVWAPYGQDMQTEGHGVVFDATMSITQVGYILPQWEQEWYDESGNLLHSAVRSWGSGGTPLLGDTCGTTFGAGRNTSLMAYENQEVWYDRAVEGEWYYARVKFSLTLVIMEFGTPTVVESKTVPVCTVERWGPASPWELRLKAIS